MFDRREDNDNDDGKLKWKYHESREEDCGRRKDLLATSMVGEPRHGTSGTGKVLRSQTETVVGRQKYRVSELRLGSTRTDCVMTSEL